MSWFQRISQRYEDTSYWGRSFHKNNPDVVSNFEVYQSPDFPNVFLGGAEDLDEAAEKAGQPICKVVDCRDLPEIDAENPSWDYGFYTAVKAIFDKKVASLAEIIQTTDCPIFVHCALGANRSVSVLASAISLLTNKPIDDILSDMKKSRMVVNPQDPYYLMALEESPAESPEFKERRCLELDQDFPLVQPDSPEEEEPFSSRSGAHTAQSEIPEDFPDDLLGDMDLLHQEKQWRRAVSTPGSLVSHNDYDWTGKVIELRGDPVNGGVVLVEYPLSVEEADQLGADEGHIVQRFYRALSLSPVMELASPFRRAQQNLNWLQKMSEQKMLIISRGPSGSGKSRMNRELSNQFEAPVFATDDFFMKSGTYKFDPSQLGAAHEWNRERVEESMRSGQPMIIVDNTNVRFWEMRPYVILAEQYGYSVDFKEPEWHPDLKTQEGSWNVDFLEEIQNQPDREKNIPRHILEKMVENYEHNPSVEAVLSSERPGRPD